MKKKTVLVTGAAGFIGRYVAREFAEQGWHVAGIGRGDWLNWSDYGLADWHRVDVNLDSLVEYACKPDAIVHCAGGSSVGFSVSHPAIDFELTVQTTSNVLEYIRLHSPATRLVYPSSAAVYGEVKTLPITEDAPLNPLSPYGLHKQMAESLCQLYSHQFGVSVAVVRLFSIYGAGLHKQLLWDACRKFDKGERDFFGTGEELRDWLHVVDVAKLILIAEKNASSQCSVINAGSGLGVPVFKILQHISEKFGSHLTPRFSSLPKTGDPSAYIADISKASALNWDPKIDWRDGISKYVEWYKQCQ
jgi:UDP-glucose 4-epimerase